MKTRGGSTVWFGKLGVVPYHTLGMYVHTIEADDDNKNTKTTTTTSAIKKKKQKNKNNERHSLDLQE
jgi:hypothetical protein